MHKLGNPGYPVESSSRCHTEHIKKIGYHLQSVVKQIPSYITNIKGFVNKVSDIKKILPNSYLAIVNTKSIYTNIVNSEGITTLEKVNIFSI